MTTPPPLVTPPLPDGPKKTPVWVWILAAVGGVIVLGIVAFGLLSYYVFKKVTEVATNPAAAAALISKIDPNLEVLDVDENKKVLRVRNRQNNEEVVISLADLQAGRLKISKEGKDGLESVEIGGQVKLPTWMPKYPDVEFKGIGAVSSDKEGDGGMFTFETGDPADKIISFYREGLEKRGFKADEGTHGGAGTAVLMMKSDADGGATVTVTPANGRSNVTVLYGRK